MTPEPSSGAPEKFDGKTSCREFLDQLDVHFHVHSEFYQSEEAKINYLLTLLKGSALQWASTIVRNKDAILQNYTSFVSTLSSIFGEPERERNAERHISLIRQGRDTALEFASKFQTIARDVPWNERALIFRFIDGLNEHLKREIVCKDVPSSLQEAIVIAVRLDNLMTVRHPQRETEHPSQHLNQSRTLYPSPDTSVKTSSETLSKEEKHQERAASGSCFYCGKPGHFIDVCKFRLRTIQGNEGAQSQH